MAKPLLDLKKNLFFKWKEEQQKAFEGLKEIFFFTLLLKFPNFTKPFKVHINASDFAIGGIFMQWGHLIAFENKKPCGIQLQWPTHEKKLYTIVWCVKT